MLRLYQSSVSHDMRAPLGGIEFTIKDGEMIRIPFPFKDTLQEYEDGVNRYINLNG